MIHIPRVTAVLSALLVTACQAPEDSVSETSDRVSESAIDLLNTYWQVEDIDQSGIIDMSMITIEFPEEERIAGSTGCNQFFGSVLTTGDSIEFSPAGVTQRACAPALMSQERRFLDALQAAVSFEVDDGIWLVLYDETDTERMRAIVSQGER
jgi:heat shock protein HslJ